MFGISISELLIIGAVCLIVFGPDKLPDLARTLGQLSAQLRRTSDTLRRDFYREMFPPLPDNPLTAAKRELMTVKNEVKALTNPLSGSFSGPSPNLSETPNTPPALEPTPTTPTNKDRH